MERANILRIYWITLVILVLPVLNTGVAKCEITTVTYQVSAWVDNAFSSRHVQYMSYIYLRVGYRNEESPPYTMCAMRFTNINAPQSTVIVDARLKIRAYSNPITGKSLYGVIHAEDADNPADFSGRYIRDIVKTDAEVIWDHVSYWETGDLYTSPDISAVVQEVIDRPGWSAGNAMVITYSNRLSDGERRKLLSYEFPTEPPHYGAPILEITCVYLRKISGFIKDDEGTLIEGVLVSADNKGGLDTTGSDGYYELFVNDGWSGTVTPSKTKWRFDPGSRAYSNVTTDFINEDYTAFPPLLISGYVSTAEGMGLEGVEVTADNGGGSMTTDSDGYYEFLVPDGWSGVVTPSKTGFALYPQSRSHNNVMEDQPNANYTLVLLKVTTATHEVSAGADDTYAWGPGQQDPTSTFLHAGYGHLTQIYPAPYKMAGMRFRNIGISQEAIITGAYLKMQNSMFVHLPGWPVYGVIHAEDADDSADFMSVKVDARPKTSASVNWDHMETAGADWWYTSPDITEVLQEVIDRPGWSTGNAMVVIYSTRRSEGYERWFWSYDKSAYSAPKLNITCVEPLVPADLEPDGSVDMEDLGIFTEQYLQRVLYSESDGRIVMEAERYFSNDEGSGLAQGSVWIDLTHSETAGISYMLVLPDDGVKINDHSNIEANSPHLSYQIDFNTPGPNTTYYLWLKGMAKDSDSNSIHYGLDGVSISSESANAARLVQGDVFTWLSETKTGPRPTVTVPSAGTHTLDIWMREDGAKIDRLLLTTDMNYDPGTNEPEESPHQPLALTADLNSDGIVNLPDFTIFAGDWGWPWIE